MYIYILQVAERVVDVLRDEPIPLKNLGALHQHLMNVAPNTTVQVRDKKKEEKIDKKKDKKKRGKRGGVGHAFGGGDGKLGGPSPHECSAPTRPEVAHVYVPYMCPHTATRCMCPHTTMRVSAYTTAGSAYGCYGQDL